MNPESNHVNNSNCFNNNKEYVKRIIDQKVLLLVTVHSRAIIFSRDSLLERATQMAKNKNFMSRDPQKFFAMETIFLNV